MQEIEIDGISGLVRAQPKRSRDVLLAAELEDGLGRHGGRVGQPEDTGIRHGRWTCPERRSRDVAADGDDDLLVERIAQPLHEVLVDVVAQGQGSDDESLQDDGYTARLEDVPS